MRGVTIGLVCLMLLAMLSQCVPNGPDSPYISTLVPTSESDPTALVPGTSTPAPDDDLTLVILGLDRSEARCARNERCQEPHSDVFVIVHVQDDKATVVLVPRSLYVPEWQPPMWSMAVYGKLGAAGVRQYVSVVFGLPVDGVFAIDMSQFALLIDKMGGLEISGAGPLPLSGTELLAYLRDNENNWGCATYDCEGRIFKVAEALRARSSDLVFWTLGANGLFESDLRFDEVLGLLSRYYDFERADGTVNFVRLWRPDPVETADTPLEIRGLVPVRPLTEWMQDALEG